MPLRYTISVLRGEDSADSSKRVKLKRAGGSLPKPNKELLHGEREGRTEICTFEQLQMRIENLMDNQPLKGIRKRVAAAKYCAYYVSPRKTSAGDSQDL
jgi:hypothetical protein